MNDLLFDIVARDLVMANNDFAISNEASQQNGGIIQNSRCAFVYNPLLGIGMEEIINSNTTKTAYEMNRWQQQCKTDGATVASWSSQLVGSNQIKIDTQISYE